MEFGIIGHVLLDLMEVEVVGEWILENHVL